MKKLSYILFIAASVLAAACSKEVSYDETSYIETPSEIVVPEESVTYTFTVDANAKSSLTNGGVFSWVAGDHIAIYNSTSSSYVTFEVTAVDGSGNATITASAAAGAVWTNAIYPAERAAGDGNGVDYTVQTVSGPILVSKVEGQTLSFKYLGAVANIQVNDVPGTPSKLTFTANANVFGSRTFSWSGDDPVLGGAGSQASITVPFTNNTLISVPIPQVSYAGFTITVDNEAGRHLYKKTTGNTFNMTNKKLLPMPALTYVEPGYYVKTTAANVYWNTDAARMIKTGASTYVLSENCCGNTTYYIFDEYNMASPTTAYVATGLAKSTFPTGASEWSIVGDVNGNNWNITSNHVEMTYEGDWHFVRNVRFDNIVAEEHPYAHFLIVNGTDWGSLTKYCEANIFPGNTGVAYATKDGSWDIYAKDIVADTDYDIFFNVSSKEVRLFLSSANHDPNEASGIWQFTYNSSTGLASHVRKSDIKDDPFGDDKYPKAGLGIKGSWNDWASVYTEHTSYVNQSWVISNFAPGSADTFNFGLCNSSSGYWTALCTDSRFATVNPGTNLYGTLTYWDNGGLTNPAVTLENATYTVYVNVNPDVNGGVNLMFVKN